MNAPDEGQNESNGNTSPSTKKSSFSLGLMCLPRLTSATSLFLLNLVFAYAVEPSPKLVAWGDNQFGQTNVPPGLSNVVSVAAGGYHNLALTAEHRVVGWGRDDFGQATMLSGLTNVVAIAAGGYHSVALLSDGSVVVHGHTHHAATPM